MREIKALERLEALIKKSEDCDIELSARSWSSTGLVSLSIRITT